MTASRKVMAVWAGDGDGRAQHLSHPSGSDKGMISSTSAPISMSAVCQPKAAMKAWPKGAKMNWPSEPAAVAMPKAQERFSGGTSRPKAAMTRVKEAVAMPTPAMRPPVRIHEARRIREWHQGNARRIDQSADDEHARRAVFVGKAAGDRLENAPDQILERHGEAIDLAMPLIGLGDRIGEEPHGGAGAERNDSDQAAGGDDDGRVDSTSGLGSGGVGHGGKDKTMARAINAQSRNRPMRRRGPTWAMATPRRMRAPPASVLSETGSSSITAPAMTAMTGTR